MFLSPEWLVFDAFIIGIISAVSLPLGAITSFYWRPDQRVIAALMAFGAGSLLAALTIDLVAPSVHHGHFNILAVGCLAGGLLFIALDNIVGNFGGYRRKFSTALHHRHFQNRQRLKSTLLHLGRMEIFQELKDEDVELLSQSLESRFYAKGSKIFLDGEISDELYVIQEGEVELYDPKSQNATRARYKENNAFGKSALFLGLPHAFIARATEDSYISVIPKEALERLLLVSEEYRAHVKKWLESREIEDYLENHQNITKEIVDTWRAEVEETFDEECILPDLGGVTRHEEEFVKIAEDIKKIPWMEELAEEEIEALSGYLTHKEYKKDELIFAQGEPAEHLYIIHEGEVVLTDEFDKTRVYRETGGTAIGGMAFFCGLRHTMGAKATTDVKVWALKRYELGKIIDKHADFRLRVLFHLQEPAIKEYLEKKYSLNQAKVLSWLDSAAKSIKSGKLPPSLLEMGIESTNPHGASLAIWLGILLDGIPESLVIGANMIHNSISISLVAGLFLSNYPEALSSSRGMRDEHFSKAKILILWTSIMIFTGLGAALGNVFMQEAEPHWFAFIEGLAAGAMLTMIAQTMLPEAYSKGGSVVGFATLLGFLVTISLKGFEG